MLNRLNQILDSWEHRNRKSHWLSTAAKGLLTFGVAAGAMSVANKAEAGNYCSCSNQSCYGCHHTKTIAPWYCNDYSACCTVKFTLDCMDENDRWLGHCGGTQYPYC